MTRNDIKKYFAEATDEQINNLLNTHSEDIGKAKTKAETDYTALKTDYDTLKANYDTMGNDFKQLKDNNASAEDWKAKFDGLQAENTKREEAARIKAADDELTSKIRGAFPKDKEFVNEYVEKALLAEIKDPHNKDNTIGLQVHFDNLIKDKEGIFKSDNPPVNMGESGNIDLNTDSFMVGVMKTTGLTQK